MTVVASSVVQLLYRKTELATTGNKNKRKD
jgi:hypothetical protein